MDTNNIYELDKKLVNNGKGSSLLTIPKFWLQANGYSITEEVTVIPIANFLIVTRKQDPIKDKLLKILKKTGFLK